MSTRALSLALLAAISVAACDRRSVTIERIVDTETPFNGMSYFLPKGIVELDIRREAVVATGCNDSKKCSKVTLTINSVRYVPDPDFQYSINIDHDVFHSDKIIVQVGNDQLLSSISSTVKDETPEILKRLANAPIEILGGAPSEKALGAGETKKWKYYDIKFTLDPTNDRDVRRLRKFLGNVDPLITFNARPMVSTTRTGGPVPNCSLDPCFRTAMPYVLELVSEGFEKETVTQVSPEDSIAGEDKAAASAAQSPGTSSPSEPAPPGVAAAPTVSASSGPADESLVVARSIVVLPNKYVVGQVALTRAPFVQKRFDLSFTNGMLTKADLDNPSEALAFIQIPIDVAKSIVAIPSALFNFQVKQVQSDNSLLREQKTNLDLQKQIIDVQRQLVTAQTVP